uniref:Solute carrier family 30 member 1 n=1 Tax=Scleropages formosus TaxID=113540 RepID=A0A8C9TM42_SCLFO
CICAPPRAELLCLLCTTSCFFVVELLLSRVSESLAVLSDSFQVLSDALSLSVALLDLQLSRKTRAAHKKNTFGWVRAQVMGSLVQAVFLSALRFSVVLDAVERLTEPRAIRAPRLLFAVGVAGLLVKLLGLRAHALPRGRRRRRSAGSKARACERARDQQETNNLMMEDCSSSFYKASQMEDLDVHMIACVPCEESTADLDLRRLLLRLLGVLLGSATVLIDAVVFTFVWPSCPDGENCPNPCLNTHCSGQQHIRSTISDTPTNAVKTSLWPCWVLYLDPALCILVAGILLCSTYPLLKESALILLQAVPKQIDVSRLGGKLRKLEGVLAIHELHIWQLSGSRLIATAHIKCQGPASYMDVARRVKSFLHDEGVHATTVQPEFVQGDLGLNLTQCELPCLAQCASKLCCSTQRKHGLRAKEDEDYHASLPLLTSWLLVGMITEGVLKSHYNTIRTTGAHTRPL